MLSSASVSQHAYVHQEGSRRTYKFLRTYKYHARVRLITMYHYAIRSLPTWVPLPTRIGRTTLLGPLGSDYRLPFRVSAHSLLSCYTSHLVRQTAVVTPPGTGHPLACSKKQATHVNHSPSCIVTTPISDLTTISSAIIPNPQLTRWFPSPLIPIHHGLPDDVCKILPPQTPDLFPPRQYNRRISARSERPRGSACHNRYIVTDKNKRCQPFTD